MKVYRPDLSTPSSMPYFENPVKAGFPSPADDYTQMRLDLNEHLISHPAATFFVRVEGDSMVGAGIQPGDLLIVDRSLEAQNGKIVLAVINGEFTVKRIRKEGEMLFLEPENPKYPPIQVLPSWDFYVWGIVTYVIHECTR